MAAFGNLQCIRVYFAIGVLFLMRGLYRAVSRPGSSVVLASVLSRATVGITEVWRTVPIGWLEADVAGAVRYFTKRPGLLRSG